MTDSRSEWTVVIAAGPSLTRADCDALRGFDAIAVNCAVWFAPWAGTMYASDLPFWDYYGPKCRWYRGERFGMFAGKWGVRRYEPRRWNRKGGNSGHQAMTMALDRRPCKVALIGFDHKHTGGRAHFHGDHPRHRKVRLGNAAAVKHWAKAMYLTAKDVEKKKRTVVNITRDTALNCFPRETVEEFLGRFE